MNVPLTRLVFTLIALTFFVEVSAQLPAVGAKDDTEAVKFPDDSLGRRTPRGTVTGYVQAVADQNYQRASRYFNLKRSYRSTRQRERIVKAMQRMLDQGGELIPTSFISNKYEGRLDDDLAQGLDLIGTVAWDKETINIYVENTAGPNEAPLWEFSAETIAAIAKVNVDDISIIDNLLPETLKTRLLAGVPLGHWLAMLVLVVISYFGAWAIIALISFIITRLWRRARKEPVAGIIVALELPLKLVLAVWLLIAISQRVGISFIIRQRFSALTVTVFIVAFLIMLWRLTEFISTFSRNRMTRRGRVSAVSVILFLKRTIKVAIIIFGAIAILGNIGIDVTTGIAALGIGGIALALGAQKTVENFVGSVTIIADQPLRVGDYCKVGDVSGTVESIGMRSTKVRTGERTVVTIPNGDLAASKIENFAHRDRFLFDPVLEFRRDTTPDQIRYLLVELRKILYSHPMVSNEGAKVRFTGFGESSLKLETWAYILAPGFDDFQEVQEDILLRMMDVITASGSSLAYPSRTLYVADDKGQAPESAESAMGTVEKWRSENELALPKFRPETIEKLKGALEYPAPGSAIKKPDESPGSPTP